MSDLPTVDEFFAGKPAAPAAPPAPRTPAPPPAPLPSVEEFFAKPKPTDVSAFAANPEIDDEFLMHSGLNTVLERFGQGARDAWGAAPLGFAGMTAKKATDTEPAVTVEQDLERRGFYRDLATGHQTLAQAFNEQIIRPAAIAADAVMRGVSAGVRGVSEVALGAGLPRDLTPQAMWEAFPVGHFTGMPVRIPPGAVEAQDISRLTGVRTGNEAFYKVDDAFNAATARARDLGVIGKGEAGWKGFPTSADQEAVQRLTPTGVESATERPGSYLEETPPEAAAPPDVHAVARQVAPDTFTEFDALSAQKEAYRGQLAEMGDARQEDPQAVALQGRIDDILGKVAGVEDRLTNAQARRLEAARTELDTFLRTDTPDMAKVRQSLQQADFQMRDLAPDVSAAYREAERRMPAEAAPEAAPPGAEAAAAEAPPAAVPAAEGAPGAAAPAETPRAAAAPPVAPLIDDPLAMQRRGELTAARAAEVRDELAGAKPAEGAPEHLDPEIWKVMADNLQKAEASREGSVEVVADQMRYLPDDGVPKNISEREAVAVIARALDAEAARGGDLSSFRADADAAYRAAGHGEPPDVIAAEEARATELGEGQLGTTTVLDAGPGAAPAAAAPIPGGIAGDVARRWIAAGRPSEEAQIYGAYVQARYEARADAFGGAKGTAEDLYRRSFGGVRAGRGRAREPVVARELAQAPSEIKGHPEGEAEDARWRRLEPEKTAGGDYKGAPDGVATPQALGRMRGLIKKLIAEGAPGRFWYEDSARRILQITRGNLAEAEKLIGLVAIYSPQTGVFTNMNFAIKAYGQWKRGEPISVKTGAQDARAAAWLERGEDWGGRKTNNFYINLMHEIVTEYPDQIGHLNIPADVLSEIKKATVDLWVLRALGYKVDAAGGVRGGGGAANKYGFSEREIQRAAGWLNKDLPEGAPRWLPHQVQAALWSAIKARYELPAVKAATWAESIKRGFAKMEPDENGVLRQKAPGQSGPERQGHMEVWRKHALAASPEDVARQVETAKGSFGDAIDRVAQNVTAEVVPSSIGHPITDASREAKEQFTREGLSLITDDAGNDLLAAHLGIHLNYRDIGAGLFEGDINPTVVTRLVPEKPPGIFDATKARQYARAWQYIYRQDAVPLFRADHTVDFAKDYSVRNTETGAVKRFDTQREAQAEADRLTADGKTVTVRGGKFAEGGIIRFGEDLDEAAQRRLATALQEELGSDAGFTKINDREATIINFRDEHGLPSVDDQDFTAAIKRIAAREELGIEQVTHFGSEGEYGPVHDWRAEPDGGRLPADAGGSPDFQAWLRDRHEAFGRLLDEWSDPERAAAEPRPAGEPGAGPEPRAAGEPGAPRGPPGLEPGELEQARRGKVRLGTATSPPEITFYALADESTGIHELSHEWLEELKQDAADPRAPAWLKADWATTSSWLKLREGEQIPTRAHEQFARGNERFVMEGHAPTKALAAVFARFRDWLIRIYQTVDKLNVPLTDEMRGVYGRLVASQREAPVIAPERQLAPAGPRPGIAALDHLADRIGVDARDYTPEQIVEMASGIMSPEELAREIGGLEATAEHALAEFERRTGAIEGAPEPEAVYGDQPQTQEEQERALAAAQTSAATQQGEGGAGAPGRPAGSEGVRPEGAGERGPGAEAADRTTTQPSEAPAAPNAAFGPSDGRLVDKAGNIRLDNLNAPEDVEQAIRDAAERNNDFVTERRGVITDGQMLDLADAIGKDPSFLNEKKIGAAFSAEEILAARKLLVESATTVRDAMIRAASGTDADVAAMAQAIIRHEMIQAKVAQATAEWGRAGRAFRALEGWEGARDLNQLLKDNTGRTLNQLRQMAQLGQSLTTPAQVSKLVADSAGGRLRQAIIYYWVNTLISGPITHMTYSVGNTINALWTPLIETPLAATSGAVRRALGIAPEDSVRFHEVTSQLYGLGKGFRDGLGAAVEAYKSGVSPALPGERIPAQFLTPQEPPIPGIVGRAIGIPGKSVAAIHSFFKTLRYEQNIQALAMRDALNQGLEGDARNLHIARLTANPTEEMMASAVADSLKELYMRRQDYSSPGALLARTTNNFLPAKIILPFVKIGSEIVRNAFIERTPLGLGSAEVRGNLALREGGAAFDQQLGKIMAGTGLMAAVTIGVLEGNITGDGPSDPNERRVWLLSHTPNAVKVGPLSFSYARLGHLGMVTRFAANMTETSQRWNDEEGGKLAFAFFEGINRSVLDETWMRGLKDALDAIYHPDEHAENFITRFVAQWTPYSIGMGQVARAIDPYQRETRDLSTAQEILNQIKSHTPLWSQSLPYRRDMFGEPITVGSGTVDRYANDRVTLAMNDLHIGVAQPERKIRGVPLTAQQYDDVARIGGRMAKMELDAVVPALGNMPPVERIKTIKGIIEHHREAAATQVMIASMGTANDILAKSTDSKAAALQGASPLEVKEKLKAR